MKLPKKIIADLARAYRCTMAVSILDMQAPLSYISHYIAVNIRGYGTAADEKVCSRADYRRMIMAGRQQSKGKPFKAKILTPYQPLFSDEATAQFQDEIQVQVGNGKDKHTIHLWMSTVFKFKDGRWQMVLFHGSMPDVGSSSADTFHIKEAEKKVKELEQVVAQRTLDLKNKNRELEIEAALERVRAVAMGMKDSANMLDVCKTITQQLQLLGVKEIRNVQTAVINKEKGTYVNYEFYAKHNKQLITEVSYIDHPMTKAFIKKMLDGPNEFFKRSLKGTKVKEWYRFQKQSTQQFADRYLLTALSLDYYWYSLGPVALGVSTYKPLNKEAQALVIRLRNVFDLAYRRHLDIENARAQAREAQIEAALERVRSRSMAMHKSNELKDVIKVVLEQFVQLNINVGHAGFYIDYKAHDDMHIWLADPNIEPFFAVIPYFNTPTWNSFIEAKARGTMLHTDLLDFKTKNKFYKSLFKLFTVPQNAQQFYMQCKGLAVSTVLLENVGLYIENFSAIPYTDEENEILIRFGKVFQQTYTRFLDLQKAEAQAREAKIEAALEKIRSRSLAMHKSDELIEVVNTVFERLAELGIEQDTAIINTMDEGTRDTYMWIESKNQKYTKSIHLPYFHHTISKDVWNAYDAGEEAFCKLYSLEEKNEWFKKAFEISDLKYIPEERKSFLLETPVYAISVAFAKNISIQVISFSDNTLNATESEVLKRFTKVFYQSYTRFLDLQKAEAQAREAQIETALERVRARTMAMQKSEELAPTVKVLLDQFRLLQDEKDLDNMNRGFITTVNEQKQYFELWITEVDGTEISKSFVIDFSEETTGKFMYETWMAKHPYLIRDLQGETLDKWLEYLTSTGFKVAPGIYGSGRRVNTFVYYSQGFIGITSSLPLSNNNIQLLERFAKVFEQTYTRFLDLQNAEAQTREAQVEAALERVRSKTMAMHSSEDVGETVATLFTEFINLGIRTNRCGILIFNDETSAEVWTARANPEGKATLIIGRLFLHIHNLFTSVYRAWNSKEAFYQYELKGDDLVNYYEAINTSKFYPTRFDLSKLPEIEIHSDFFFQEGAVFAFTNEFISEEHSSIFKRFATVFGQTYRRFLDLQKAEAQAREAQIEASLERVRASSMAMHKSDELSEVVLTIDREIHGLGIRVNNTSIITDFEDIEWGINNWIAGGGKKYLQKFHIDFTNNHLLTKRLIQALKNGEAHYIDQYNKSEKDDYFNWLFTYSDFNSISDESRKYIYGANGWTRSSTISRNSILIFQRYNSHNFTNEEISIFKRFGIAFEQAYTRFLDLQKAEAQAREAQIQLALERVRARAMAMQNSDELKELIGTVFTELTKLDLALTRCIIWVFEPATNAARWWMANSEEPSNPMSFYIKYHEHPAYLTFVQEWKRQNVKFVYDLNGADKISWDDILFNETELKQLPAIVKNGMQAPKRVLLSASFNNFGGINVASLEPLSDEHFDLLLRFAKVFDLTYTRFNDLQKAEAQAREAQIEAALEKVRSRTMAMQSSEELADAAYVLFEQLNVLGVTHERINIGIVNEQNQTIDFWVTEQGGEKLNTKFSGRISEPTTLSKAYEAWKKGEKSLMVDLQGEELKRWLKYINEEIKIPFNNAFLHDRRVQTVGFFSKGMLVVTSPEPLQEEALYLLEKFAGVFDLTYTRFSDLKLAEAQAVQAEQDLIAIKEAKQKAEVAFSELQATQKQLIQAEKMASLGELTAGIAHEIQNPLNFVNNFSEVNKEMLAEMEAAIQKGDFEEAKALAKDIADNQEKINHHGKRADGIVKSMLQHSRTSTGKKELTDINGMCDEYLRLAYHGLRAKDKSFNAKFETRFDPLVGKLMVLSQDIGRVVLNLINNAFYAVTEKKKLNIEGYEPTVTVFTKKLEDKIQITIQDNGTGIPEPIKEKIFQPFFTTKPTGQGTGLGLSLSYDIIKAHGGEILIESVEETGSTFTISLPSV